MLLRYFQVDFAVSDAELEMRDGTLDVYSAILVDPRTWAETGRVHAGQRTGFAHAVYTH